MIEPCPCELERWAAAGAREGGTDPVLRIRNMHGGVQLFPAATRAGQLLHAVAFRRPADAGMVLPAIVRTDGRLIS